MSEDKDITEIELHYNSGYYKNGEKHAFQFWDVWNLPKDDTTPEEYSLMTQPMPLVSFSRDSIHYGKKWGNTTTISLEGQVTGSDFRQMILVQS